MLITEISDTINCIFPLNTSLAWDNTGVLIDTGSSCNNILLTIDISDAVIEECIKKGIKHIISYHPVIFSGVKKLGKDDLVMKLIRNNINVFSPHTSWDEEMNQIIKEMVEGKDIEYILDLFKKLINVKHIRTANLKIKFDHVVVGVGADFKYEDFKDSLIITGEMSHHCILHAVRNNNAFILLEHSNSERITLPSMKKKLESVLGGMNIIISEEDRDPVDII